MKCRRHVPLLPFLLQAFILLGCFSHGVAAPVALPAALDNTTLDWGTGGASSWTGQTTIAKDGIDAAQATGLAAADSETWLETTVAAPGVLTWHWRLDLSADYTSGVDLGVGPDNEILQSLAQTTPWTPATQAVEGTGPVKIRWRFHREAKTPAAASDAAFVDLVAFSPFGPPVLQAPSALSAHGFTARWTALPGATGYSLEIATSADFTGNVSTFAIDSSATTFAVTGLSPATTYHHRLVASGFEVLTAISAPVAVSTTAIKRPANDAFATPTVLSGASGSLATTNLDATREPGEPEAHAASVWFSWTAPTAGRWRIRATGADFAADLLLYTGTTLPTLAPVDGDTTEGDDDGDFIEFDADAGVTYRLALDSLAGGQGTAILSWERLAIHTPPANDAFVSASPLSGAAGFAEGSNLHATAEPGEPAPALRTIWWRWTAPTSGFWTVTTGGSAISPTLRLWSGNALNALSLLATDTAADGDFSRAAIPVVAGATYRISVDSAAGVQGAVRLNWSLAIPTVAQTIALPPLPDLGVDAGPFMLSATASSGLPVLFTLVSGPATLGEDGLTLTPSGLTGVIRLTARQDGDGTYLPATALPFSFEIRPPPANDALAAAIALAGKNGSAAGSNLYATTEPADPFPASHSVWWRWTAPASGIWNLDTTGSAIPAALSVLAGPAPDDLDILATDTRTGADARLSVPVTAGATYFIGLDALEDRQGALRFTWTLTAPSLDQVIVFEKPPDLGVDAAPFTLSATASSGLSVAFALTDGPATLDGDQLTLTGSPGVVRIRASQAGDAYYRAAPDVTLAFTVRTPPANDNPAGATRISGAAGSVTGSNLYATAALADPFPASHSVWWRWTAPATGIWTVDTAGSANPTTLTILSGPSIDELDIVAADVRPDTNARTLLPVLAGAIYYIAVDAFEDRQGALRVSWNLAPPTRNQTIAFDQPLPDLVVGDPGFSLYATASSDLPVTFTLIGGPASLTDDVLTLTGKPGTVTLRASQTGDASYLAALPVTRSFAVTKPIPLKITLSDLRQTYTGAPATATATVDPAPRFTDLVITYNGDAAPPVNAGTYNVVATADDSRVTARFTVAKAPLTVTALDQRKLAGQENPEPSLAYAGFLADDDPADLVRIPSVTTPARRASPGGTYPLKPSGGISPNYAFTYVPGTLQVDSFAGRYESLLFDPVSGLPAARLELTIAPSGAAFTGLLTLPFEPAGVPLRGELILDAETDTATATLALARGTGTYGLELDLDLSGDFAATLTRDATVLGVSAGGARVFVPGNGEKLAWAGAHTALFTTPAPVDSGSAAPHPLGAGHATAVIDAKGNLKLTGTLADGQPLTATLAPGPGGDYRLFALPYPKRLQSYLAGRLPLTAHPGLSGRRYLAASAGARLTWAKAASPARPLDAAYRAGFGPLGVSVTIDPWLPPVAPKGSPAITLVQRLGLATDTAGGGVLQLAYDLADPGLGASAGLLPLRFGLSGKNAVSVVAPVTTPANPTHFALKLAPATGAFTGSFTLSDQLSPPPVKALARTVRFSGVFRQPPDAESAPTLGSGFFLVPGFAPTDGQNSGEMRLERVPSKTE